MISIRYVGDMKQISFRVYDNDSRIGICDISGKIDNLDAKNVKNYLDELEAMGIHFLIIRSSGITP